jgi:hypothetical protein
MLEALGHFRQATQTAATAWEQDMTVQQGLDIMWKLGTVIHDFRVATGQLSRYKVTSDPGDDAHAPNEEISQASWCLDAARELARTGEPAMRHALRLNLQRGAPAGGDPGTDGPAVAAAHAMARALGIPDGAWRAPAGTREARDEIVTEMMQAMDALATAVLTLAARSPEPFRTSLTEITAAFGHSTWHLRESLIVAATGNYQPGTESIASQVRAAHPLRFTHEQEPGDLASAGSAPAAALAGEGFPVTSREAPVSLPPAGADDPASTAIARRPAAGPSGPARKGR